MLPGEILALPDLDRAGYQRMLDWAAAGAKHGSYAGLIPNEAVVRTVMTPWGENIQYDAQGNEVSFYRAPRPGEVSPYGGNVEPGSGAPSAPGPPQAAAAVSESLRAIAPRILQSLSAGAPTAPTPPSIADQLVPMQSLTNGINPDDLLEFLKRMGKTITAPEPFVRNGSIAS